LSATPSTIPDPADPKLRHTVAVALHDRPALEKPGHALDVLTVDLIETGLAGGQWPRTIEAARQLCRDLVATIRANED